MARYWLSFTLDTRAISGRSYDDRWGALNEAIKGISSNYWLETTAFIVFETTKSLSDVTALAKKAVSPTFDIVLLRELDKKDGRIFGPITDNDIFKLMPYLKKG